MALVFSFLSPQHGALNHAVFALMAGYLYPLVKLLAVFFDSYDVELCRLLEAPSCDHTLCSMLLLSLPLLLLLLCSVPSRQV
jgi:hypothetical protein